MGTHENCRRPWTSNGHQTHAISTGRPSHSREEGAKIISGLTSQAQKQISIALLPRICISWVVCLMPSIDSVICVCPREMQSSSSTDAEELSSPNQRSSYRMQCACTWVSFAYSSVSWTTEETWKTEDMARCWRKETRAECGCQIDPSSPQATKQQIQKESSPPKNTCARTKPPSEQAADTSTQANMDQATTKQASNKPTNRSQEAPERQASKQPTDLLMYLS